MREFSLETHPELMMRRFPFGRRSASDSWLLYVGFNMALDFRVWSLETDGLAVPPFDRHPDGDGVLRATGLTAEGWRAWFTRIAAMPQEHMIEPFPGSALPLAFDPAAAFAGPSAVREQFREQGKEYGPLSNARKAFEREPALTRSYSGLWKELRPYHARLGGLQVHLVVYSSPVEYLVPPRTVVLGVPSTGIDAAAFRAAIFRAAEQLTAPRQ